MSKGKDMASTMRMRVIISIVRHASPRDKRLITGTQQEKPLHAGSFLAR
ncbi:hypothetical protein GbCGDNIH7_5086 [Granulibacter bethesdensis]|nr:hypothetical protein GbCGDNIH7_5086 [Granulibacter bethesdensis]